MSTPNWSNRTLWTADNLNVMRGMNSATVDLIYLDPPFNSKKDYAAPIGSEFAGAAFRDSWSLDDVKREWVEDIQADNTATWSAITVARFTNGDSAQAYLTYMAIRLLEIRRILKPSGSVYLHCDPTMSHYLKLMMDAIFDAKQFLNEIIWHYRKWSTGKYTFQRNHDVILFYSKSTTRKRGFNQLYMDRSASTLKRFGTGKIVSAHDEEGRRVPSVTVGESKGVRQDDVWDIPRVPPIKQIYLTQKPMKLLSRIISASSNEGDMVLDPFCGGATACVVAESLGRQWAGIDIEPTARDIIIRLLQEQAESDAFIRGELGAAPPDIHNLKKPPKRTDADAPQRSANIKQLLYDRQQGRCAGPCSPDEKGRKLDLDLFEVDHIRPRSKGGSDFDDNLQLLCPTCNRRKGNRTMSYLLRLTEDKP